MWLEKILSTSVAVFVITIVPSFVYLLAQSIVSILAGDSLRAVLFSTEPSPIVGILMMIAGFTLISGSIAYFAHEYVSPTAQDLHLKYFFSVIAFACGATTMRISFHLLT